MKGWKYYNHAMIPSTPPHLEPDLKKFKDGSVWKSNDGVPLFIRWTTDFDCGYETEWWYCIKDDEIDISKLKKSRRYQINRGLKNFEIIRISPKEHAEQMYIVYLEAMQNYVNAGKALDKELFINQCIKDDSDEEIEYYGAFDRQDGNLAAYSLNSIFDDFVNLTTLKLRPKYLSKNVSAALIYTMLFEYLNIQKKSYVNDGERSIRHDTKFQDFLIRYFGFRRAYCNLHVHYRKIVRVAIIILYPWRKIINKLSKNSFINNVSSLLEMEKIRRSFKDNIINKSSKKHLSEFRKLNDGRNIL